MPSNDGRHPENSQANLERKLDHAIEETFPTSDPVSVTITEGGAIDYGSQTDAAFLAAEERPEQHEQGKIESLLDQAKETLGKVGGTASEVAREAYSQGGRYLRQASDKFPKAERFYHQSNELVRQGGTTTLLLTLLVGMGAGYALERLMDARGSGGDREDRGVPDYARTRTRYAQRR